MSKEINAMGETSDGRLWLATSNGLVRFEADENSFYHYTTQNSQIASNSVLGLLVDDKDQIWVSTLAGISRFDPKTQSFQNFDEDLGSQGRAFNVFAYYKDVAGVMYFGGPNGLNFFYPDQVHGNPVPPKLTFRDLKIYDASVMPGRDAPIDKDIALAEHIQLDHDENDVTFDFVGLHFSNPEKNTYLYKMDNYDRDWRSIDEHRPVTYTSLNPGEYVFRVKAANAYGVWADEELAVSVSISSPWWWRPAAFVGYFLLLGGLIYAIDRYQRAKLLRKERAVARIREAQLRAEAAELRSRAAESEALVLKTENERKEIELQKAQQLKEAYDALQDSMDQLKRTQRQLVQAEKMASLGQLTAGIAHEIKNPLNFVVNFASLSKNLIIDIKEVLTSKDVALDPEGREEIDEMLAMLTLNTERINDHGCRADNIVRSMMEHSRPSENALEETALAAILNQSIDFACNGSRKEFACRQIDIVKEYDPEIGMAKLMPQDFSRVIINILDNAFHAVEEAAASRNGLFVPRVKVKTIKERDAVVVIIEDNGIGMSDAVKSKIFDPFYTTKPTGTGNTGLGLSLSYDIIAQGHNGTFQVESEPGAGAKFVIRLPA